MADDAAHAAERKNGGAASHNNKRGVPTWAVGGLLTLGVLGLVASVMPWDSIMNECPYLVRNSLSGPLTALGFLPSGAPPGVGGGGTRALPPSRGPHPDTGLPTFLESDLRPYDGSGGTRILLGMAGDVFDVTDKGAHFYGPGAGYSVFAARDATRSLALGSMDEVDLARGGDVSDFNAEQRGAVAEQHAFYKGKYTLVGHLVQPGAGGGGSHTPPVPAG